MSAPQHFVFALVEDFTHMAFACAVDPLRIANMISGAALYRWSYASEDGVAARSSDGTVIAVHHAFSSLPRSERLFVLSGIHMQQKDTTALIASLRRMDRHGATRIGALCSGAYVLARAGFLDGRAAAIHWEYHDGMMASFPDVRLVRNVFVADERYITASGGTATADLMLHLIEADHGRALASAVADQMVYATVREASAEQKASLQARDGMRNAHLAGAITLMRDTLDDPLPAPAIAERQNISIRQLERLFGRYLNTTPMKYYMDLRLERARHLLLQTEMSAIDIALACGFESPGHFSRVYRTAFGVTPMAQRDRLS